ncbi:hypothetical protein Q9L58_004327 [Maublancomyces gigas]|uniref:NADH:ubiquinone oxidoreductase intermediate-associated protein 30 domain-containing protein n=1 Tax=Discina gigas TaxID=1032678 RepID=A0ABR3GLD2_9PEZI
MATRSTNLALFGGSKPWKSSEWTAQNDTLRGGSSVSHLIPSSNGTAIFSGNLDTTTLGSAGFASQRTTEDRVWDLSCFEGIEIVVGEDVAAGIVFSLAGIVFTLVLKDSLPPSNTDRGVMEESTISYETTFSPGVGERVYLPFVGFKAMYRGRAKEDAPPVNLANIKRFSLMVRSFFGTQSGPFQLTLVSISAVTPPGSL